MQGEHLKAERDRLAKLLESYESGRLTSFDEDSRGELTKDATAERIASVRGRIADLDRRIAEFD